MENKTISQFFEWYLPSDGTLWEKAEACAADLKNTGITSVWLPPAYKGAAGVSSVGYDVYDLYDLGEFDQIYKPWRVQLTAFLKNIKKKLK